MEFWGALAFSGVVSFVRMVSAIACIYAACMVGHQFKNHPALAGILSFFVMQYLQGWLEKLLQIGTGVYETIIYSAVGDVGSIETASRLWATWGARWSRWASRRRSASSGSG